MESHLLEIFSGHDVKETVNKATDQKQDLWSSEATAELNKVPGPFRKKVRTNVEKFAKEQNISLILVETMMAAREAVS